MSRKILEGSVLSLFSLENMERDSSRTCTHAFGTYYIIKHFVLRCIYSSREKVWLHEANSKHTAVAYIVNV